MRSGAVPCFVFEGMSQGARCALREQKAFHAITSVVNLKALCVIVDSVFVT